MRPFSRSAKQASVFCSRLIKWLLLCVCHRPRRRCPTGGKKQADFSCVNARKAVYCPDGRGQAAPRQSSSEFGSALGLHCP